MFGSASSILSRLFSNLDFNSFNPRMEHGFFSAESNEGESSKACLNE